LTRAPPTEHPVWNQPSTYTAQQYNYPTALNGPNTATHKQRKIKLEAKILQALQVQTPIPQSRPPSAVVFLAVIKQ
jgi:hypothetical protein